MRWIDIYNHTKSIFTQNCFYYRYICLYFHFWITFLSGSFVSNYRANTDLLQLADSWLANLSKVKSKVLAGHVSGCWHSALGDGLPYKSEKNESKKYFFYQWHIFYLNSQPEQFRSIRNYWPELFWSITTNRYNMQIKMQYFWVKYFLMLLLTSLLVYVQSKCLSLMFPLWWRECMASWITLK